MISTYTDKFRAAIETACFDAKGFLYGGEQTTVLLNTAAAINWLDGVSEEEFVIAARKAYANLTRSRVAGAVKIVDTGLASEKKA